MEQEEGAVEEPPAPAVEPPVVEEEAPPLTLPVTQAQVTEEALGVAEAPTKAMEVLTSMSTGTPQ